MRRWMFRGLLCAVMCLGALAAPLDARAQAPAGASAKLPEVKPLGMQARVQPERVLLGEPFV